MHERRRAALVTAALVVLDIAFLVALAIVCDTIGSGARTVPLYTLAVVVFVARTRHYYRFVDIALRYRVDPSLPLPVSEAQSMFVAVLYSALAHVVQLVAGKRDIPASVQRMFVSVWAIVVVGNITHAVMYDDRAALRRLVQRRLAVMARRRSGATVVDNDPTYDAIVSVFNIDDDETSDNESLFDGYQESRRTRVVSAIKPS